MKAHAIDDQNQPSFKLSVQVKPYLNPPIKKLSKKSFVISEPCFKVITFRYILDRQVMV